ncbi:hypothetical protein HJC23_006468 [Cyclotella cryptica]|uniref:Helicase-associated domain-containing protein n=1 Tax=Cyclotella cryptica TaxID=29204 RepID=A0ABD3QUW4_9STRA|eukprot:CCRYP_001905-RA/>CCRYP_001905-RA protein AED:0.31 eAED:0.05 QI:0/-1/0/1/-1/1/1/0/257
MKYEGVPNGYTNVAWENKVNNDDVNDFGTTFDNEYPAMPPPDSSNYEFKENLKNAVTDHDHMMPPLPPLPTLPDGTVTTLDMFCDFTYPKPKKSWIQWFTELKEFKAVHNHCLVPYSMNGLSQWVRRQHRAYSNNTSDSEQKKLLDGIGFVWRRKGGGINNESWKRWFAELKEFKVEHGHCNVPTTKTGFGGWVQTQREEYSNNALHPERKKLLNEIGFVWKSHNNHWNRCSAELKAINAQHNHCNIQRDRDSLLHE